MMKLVHSIPMKLPAKLLLRVKAGPYQVLIMYQAHVPPWEGCADMGQEKALTSPQDILRNQDMTHQAK